MQYSEQFNSVRQNTIVDKVWKSRDFSPSHVLGYADIHLRHQLYSADRILDEGQESLAQLRLLFIIPIIRIDQIRFRFWSERTTFIGSY